MSNRNARTDGQSEDRNFIMQQWQVGPVPDITYFSNSNTHQQNEMHAPPQSYQQDMNRRNEQQRMDFPPYGQHQPGQPHHPPPVQPPMSVPQPPTGPPGPQSQQPAPTPPAASRRNKRPAPPTATPTASSAPQIPPVTPISAPQTSPPIGGAGVPAPPAVDDPTAPVSTPPVKKSRTNTPWTPAEELRLKQMRDAGKSWAEIAKTFPTRTEGSVKKHWYKDMHYAEFAEDESQALMNAIKEYENNKWKVIGQKVGKPAKACEQYAKEHFPELFGQPKQR